MRNGKNPGIVHLLPGYTVTAKILFFEDASKYAMVIPSLIDITGLRLPDGSEDWEKNIRTLTGSLSEKRCH